MTLATIVARVASWIVWACVALAPSSFRARFGRAIADDTCAELDAASRGGTLEVTRVSAAAIYDAARGCAAEHLTHYHQRATGRSGSMIVGFRTDVRMAARAVRGRPWLTVIVIGTLGLAIGAATAMFSVADAVLLRSLPFPDSERLVKLEESTVAAGTAGASFAAIEIWTKEADALESVAWQEVRRALVMVGDEPDRLVGAMVSRNYFEVLGIAPAAGRSFSHGPAFGGPSEVVISDRLWRRLGGTDAVLGRYLPVDPGSFLIVGVMGEGFDHPSDADFWTTPSQSLEMIATSRMVRFLDAFGRLRPAARLESLQAQMAVLTGRYPYDDRRHGAVRMTATGLRDSAVAQVRPAITVVVAAAIVLLLIASMNVAALLLSRRRRAGNVSGRCRLPSARPARG